MSDLADNLLKELSGLGTTQGDSESPREATQKEAAAVEPSEQLDQWRMLLVDLVYLLNGAFRDAHYWEGVKKGKDTVRQFVEILHKLQQMPQNDGIVRIEFRGSPGTKISEKSDYIIRFGDLTVDVAAASAMIKRIGIRVKHIEGRLIKSFEAFSAQGMDTIKIKIPQPSDGELEKMRICMRIISSFKKAVEDDAPITYDRDEETVSLNPVLNESRQPDPNLTQLAALNNLSPRNMQEMIQKVGALMKRPDFSKSGQPAANVYETIFNIKSLRQKLIRPAIELNSNRAQLDAKTPKETTSGGDDRGSGPGGPPLQINPAVLKANVARFVKETYGDSPQKAVKVMRSIYSNDYHQLDFAGLEGRLTLITDLLSTLESSDKAQHLMGSVLERIQAGMDQLPKDMLDDLVIDGDEIKIWENDKEKVIGKSDGPVLNIIDTSKDRSAVQKKGRAALKTDGQFTEQDYEHMSKTFDISIQEAEEITFLFKRCFDGQGNFQRVLFEKNVPEFANHSKRIFEILWGFLREIPRRSDRLPFLNSLQLLVREIKQPMQASKILMSDFILDPANVSFPDRNAMMLTIQFLRTYNKELNVDIEITPEEVLLVKIGLDPSVTRYMAWKINGEQKRFVEKVVTIRKKLIKSFEQAGSDFEVLPIRFLLALEREVHIFLALVGGKTATTVIQAALNVYGNPASQIFQLKESPNYMSGLLQHLGILIRGIGRVGHKTDLALLDDIQKRQPGFMDLSAEPRHTTLVKRTLGAIDAAKHEIGLRNDE